MDTLSCPSEFLEGRGPARHSHAPPSLLHGSRLTARWLNGSCFDGFQSQKSIIMLDLGEGRVAACRSSIRQLLKCERRQQQRTTRRRLRLSNSTRELVPRHQPTCGSGCRLLLVVDAWSQLDHGSPSLTRRASGWNSQLTAAEELMRGGRLQAVASLSAATARAQLRQ